MDTTVLLMLWAAVVSLVIAAVSIRDLFRELRGHNRRHKDITKQ